MPTKANFPSMRRLVIPIAALLALLAIPAGANAYTLGVSDQQASTFTNPLFAPLKFKAARYITPYDVMESPSDKAQWDAWYSAATAAHQKVLISFEHSHRSNSRALKAPSVAAYTKELKKFKAAYPGVREISPWNEVNRCHRTIGGSVQAVARSASSAVGSSASRSAAAVPPPPFRAAAAAPYVGSAGPPGEPPSGRLGGASPLPVHTVWLIGAGPVRGAGSSRMLAGPGPTGSSRDGAIARPDSLRPRSFAVAPAAAPARGVV